MFTEQQLPELISSKLNLTVSVLNSKILLKSRTSGKPIGSFRPFAKRNRSLRSIKLFDDRDPPLLATISRSEVFLWQLPDPKRVLGIASMSGIMSSQANEVSDVQLVNNTLVFSTVMLGTEGAGHQGCFELLIYDVSTLRWVRCRRHPHRIRARPLDAGGPPFFAHGDSDPASPLVSSGQRRISIVC